MDLAEDLRSLYRDFAVPAICDGRTVFVIKDEESADVDPGSGGGIRFSAPVIWVRFITADLPGLASGKEMVIAGIRYKTIIVNPIADGLESSARIEKIK